jgi:uncharacterized protein
MNEKLLLSKINQLNYFYMKWLKLTKNNLLTLQVFVKPGAKKTEIVNLTQEEIEIKLHAPPVDGKANLELTTYLAKVLHLKKSDVKIVAGEKSKEKIICVKNLTQEEIETSLTKEFKNYSDCQ